LFCLRLSPPAPGGIDLLFSQAFTIPESGTFEIEALSVGRKK